MTKILKRRMAKAMKQAEEAILKPEEIDELKEILLRYVAKALGGEAGVKADMVPDALHVLNHMMHLSIGR